MLAAMGLSACAVGSPATITSTQGSTQSIQSVELLAAEEVTGLRGQFLAELQKSLGSRGIALERGAEFVGDFSVSERSAELGLQAISDDTEGQTDARAPEPGYQSRWYDKCSPHRVSASLVIYSRASGEVRAKSSGEFLSCPGDLAELSNLANLLVGRAVSN
jgi:hypothetical protein